MLEKSMYLPQDIVDTDDTFSFIGFAVVNDCSLCLQPYVTAFLSQEPVMTGRCLAFGKYWKQKMEGRKKERKINILKPSKIMGSNDQKPWIPFPNT